MDAIFQGALAEAQMGRQRALSWVFYSSALSGPSISWMWHDIVAVRQLLKHCRSMGGMATTTATVSRLAYGAAVAGAGTWRGSGIMAGSGLKFRCGVGCRIAFEQVMSNDAKRLGTIYDFAVTWHTLEGSTSIGASDNLKAKTDGIVASISCFQRIRSYS